MKDHPHLNPPPSRGRRRGERAEGGEGDSSSACGGLRRRPEWNEGMTRGEWGETEKRRRGETGRGISDFVPT